MRDDRLTLIHIPTETDEVAATAVARELIGFVWAVLHDFDITQLQHSEVSRAA